MTARLRGVTDSGDWLFSQAGKTVQVAKDRLVVWGACQERFNRTCVLLRDGTLLVADLLEIANDEVVIVGRLWSEIRLPRSQVQAIVLRPPLDNLARDALFIRAWEQSRTQDVLVMDHGDQLLGTVPAIVEPEPGGFHPSKIRWPVRGAAEPVDISLDRVTAILFKNPDDASTEDSQQLWVGLSDGSRVHAERIEMQTKSLVLHLSSGFSLATDEAVGVRADPLESVVFLQPFSEQVTYLSDLEPLGYKHIPYLATPWPYRRDRNVQGGFLRVHDELFVKGIGMHSSSRLAYDLPGRYHALHAELAIDQCADGDGSVIFRLYCQDSMGEWSKAYESDVVRGGQRPVSMRVELQDAVRIALIVDFADRADQGDHANWLNARLVR
jgi:hypothetical protein